MAQILSDELGQSFQLKENDSTVTRGKECLYTNIATVNNIATFLQTSLGPTGMDKILVDKDGGFTVTNDGATILREMDMTNNPVSQLILQLSESQDEEVGDGTTSIVIIAAAILNQVKCLMEKGMHPIKISEGFNLALSLAEKHLEKISEDISELNTGLESNGTQNTPFISYLLKAAKTSLGSKIASLGDFSGFCVEAALAVTDLKRRDLDLELINVLSTTGKSLADTKLVKGLVIKKGFSHPQMAKTTANAKIALLSCPFEPPKLKNSNSLLISNVEEYKKLEEYEKNKFSEMIQALKACKVDVVICQWGFDDEANSMLMQNGIPAIRWVGGNDLGLIASHINGSIIARFEDLTEESLGIANIKEDSLGTESESIITIESPTKNRAVSIIVRGSSEYVIEEGKRSIRDALCAIRNVITCGKIVYGGGSSELSTSVYLEKRIKESSKENCNNKNNATKECVCFTPEEEESIRSYAKALLEIPLTLAKNSGLDSVEYVEKLREQHLSGTDFVFGVDCLETGEKNMKKAGIFETLKSKTRQLKMATDLVNTILKINEVILLE